MSVQTDALLCRASDRRDSRRDARVPHLHRLTALQSCVASVTRVDPPGWVVDTGRGDAIAQRAASCLATPEVGDLVACLCTDDDRIWIVAILQRASETPLVLDCEGAMRVQAAAFTVTAQDVDFESERLRVRSTEAAVSSARVRVTSGVVKLAGTLMSSVFERVSHFGKHYLRTTQGLDRVQAEHLEIDAGQLLRVQGEHAIIQGEKLVKARGGQIHFG